MRNPSKKKILFVIGIVISIVLSGCASPIMKENVYITCDLLSGEAQLISNAYGSYAEHIYKYSVDKSIKDKVFYLKVRGNEGEFHKKTLLKDEDITKKCSFVLGTDIDNKTIYIGLEDGETHGFSGPRELDIPDYNKEELEKEVLDESVAIEKGKMIPLETYYAIDEDGNRKEVFSICVEFK